MQQNREACRIKAHAESYVTSFYNLYIQCVYVCASVTLDLCWPYRKKKTMKLSRALSDLVKYTRSVGLYDIEAQGKKLSLLMWAC